MRSALKTFGVLSLLLLLTGCVFESKELLFEERDRLRYGFSDGFAFFVNGEQDGVKFDAFQLYLKLKNGHYIEFTGRKSSPFSEAADANYRFFALRDLSSISSYMPGSKVLYLGALTADEIDFKAGYESFDPGFYMYFGMTMSDGIIDEIEFEKSGEGGVKLTSAGELEVVERFLKSGSQQLSYRGVTITKLVRSRIPLELETIGAGPFLDLVQKHDLGITDLKRWFPSSVVAHFETAMAADPAFKKRLDPNFSGSASPPSGWGATPGLGSGVGGTAPAWPPVGSTPGWPSRAPGTTAPGWPPTPAWPNTKTPGWPNTKTPGWPNTKTPAWPNTPGLGGATTPESRWRLPNSGSSSAPAIVIPPVKVAPPTGKPRPTAPARVAAPTRDEMRRAVERTGAFRAATRLNGASIERFEKRGCDRLSSSDFRCSYRIWLKIDCQRDPINCFAARLGGGAVLNSGRFSKTDRGWRFHGAGT